MRAIHPAERGTAHSGPEDNQWKKQMQRSVLLGLMTLVILSCSGCVEDRYDVKMELLPDTVNRTVTVIVQQHALDKRAEEREVDEGHSRRCTQTWNRRTRL
jgi:hypothetical protein